MSEARHGTYTHGHHESVLRSHRTRTAENSAAYLLPHLSAGMRLLDVGCGPGTITVDLARLVAPGRVTALDPSPQALAATRQLAREAGVTTVDVTPGDVFALPFDADTFDVVHTHQVLQHVGDPVAALREMVRVTRPGGLVAARDADYAAFAWFPEVPVLDHWRSLYDEACRANGGEPNAGRRLLAWAHAAGCQRVTASASTWCYAEPGSRQAWGAMWAERIVASALADQLLTTGLADRDDLAGIADGWLAWAGDPDSWILIPHGEVLVRV